MSERKHNLHVLPYASSIMFVFISFWVEVWVNSVGGNRLFNNLEILLLLSTCPIYSESTLLKRIYLSERERYENINNNNNNNIVNLGNDNDPRPHYRINGWLYLLICNSIASKQICDNGLHSFDMNLFTSKRILQMDKRYDNHIYCLAAE